MTREHIGHARDRYGHAPNAGLHAVRFAGGALADIETYGGAQYVSPLVRAEPLRQAVPAKTLALR